MPRTSRRKIGTTYTLEGPAWNPTLIAKDKFSRVPGTGSIDKIKRGRYTYFRGRIWADDELGVHRRVEVTGQSEAEVRRKLKELQEKPIEAAGKKLLLGKYLRDRFLPGMKLRVRPKTYDSYSRAIELHIEPKLGRVKLALLTPSNVLAWLRDLDVRPRAKQQAFVVLKRALAFAVDLGLLDHNQLANMKAPSAPKGEQYILSLEEVQKLLATCKEHKTFARWYPLVFLAIATSARRGELFGLQWRDVNFEDGYVLVRQALGQVYDDDTVSGYRTTLTEPKTAAARRRIDLAPEAIEVLKSHRKGQMRDCKRNPRALVFPNETGGFIHPSNWYRRVWMELVKKAELPAISFHSLRHVGNTLLAAKGVSLALLQSRLGHSTSAATFIYSHLTATEGQRGARLIGSMLSGETSGETATRDRSARNANAKKNAL